MWSREAPPLGQEPPGAPRRALLRAPGGSCHTRGTPEGQEPLLGSARAGPEPEPRRSTLVPQLLLQPPAVWNWTRRFWSNSGPQPRPAPGRAEPLESPGGVSSQTDPSEQSSACCRTDQSSFILESHSPSAASCGPAVLSSRSSGQQSFWTPAFCAQPGELYSGLRPLLTSRRAPRHRESRPSSN